MSGLSLGRTDLPLVRGIHGASDGNGRQHVLEDRRTGSTRRAQISVRVHAGALFVGVDDVGLPDFDIIKILNN